MKKYKQKFLWRNIFYSNFTIVFFILMTIWILSGLYKMYLKYEYTKADLISVRDERDAENLKLSNIKNKMDNINTETGKDKYIRETYSVVKPGENMIIVYEKPNSTYDIKKGDTFWQKFIQYIKNIFGF